MEKLIAYAYTEFYGTLRFKEKNDPYSVDLNYSVTFYEDVPYTESDTMDEEHNYNQFLPAYEMFKALAKRHNFGTVNLCNDFEDRYGQILDPDPYYTRSAEAGDYSPSCPWNAPGMSIHDFI